MSDSQPSSSSNNDDQNPPGPDPSGQSSGNSGSGVGNNNMIQSIMNHYSANKLDALLMVTRVLTLLFSLSYLLPFGCGVSCFRKALIANAATSALRLHQRLPGFQLNREYMSQLLLEDSCHYLLFSVIFLYSYPITLVLLPLSLFAFLHVSSNTLILLDKTGNRSCSLGTTLSGIIERHQKTILLTVSMSEVVLMPVVILAVFSGICSLLSPFVYYRFLSFRYASRRNPYTRQTFRLFRQGLEQLMYLPACPAFVRNGLRSIIDIICRLAPPTVPQTN